MPNIENYDNEDDWMAACVPMRINEGDDQDQAVAVCMSMWREHHDAGKIETHNWRSATGKAPMEYKSLVHQIKQINGRTVTGFAAIFGNVDSGNDRTWRGAFKKTITERAGRVRHLWQHDLTQPPIAAIREMREVSKDDLPDDLRAKYPEATGGLMVVREYLDTPRGDEVLKGIISGAVSEMSFGYDPIKYDFEGKPDKGETVVRNLREVRLWDTSDVNWGMNEATIASKNDPAVVLAQLLDNLKAAQGFDPAALEKSGRVLSAANLAKLRTALETLTAILSAAEPADDVETDSGKTASVVTPAILTDAELVNLKARWDALQRQINLYQTVREQP